MLSTIGYCCWFDIQSTSSLHPSKSIHWPTSLQGSLWVFLLEGVVKTLGAPISKASKVFGSRDLFTGNPHTEFL